MGAGRMEWSGSKLWLLNLAGRFALLHLASCIATPTTLQGLDESFEIRRRSQGQRLM